MWHEFTLIGGKKIMVNLNCLTYFTPRMAGENGANESRGTWLSIDDDEFAVLETYAEVKEIVTKQNE